MYLWLKIVKITDIKEKKGRIWKSKRLVIIFLDFDWGVLKNVRPNKNAKHVWLNRQLSYCLFTCVSNIHSSKSLFFSLSVWAFLMQWWITSTPDCVSTEAWTLSVLHYRMNSIYMQQFTVFLFIEYIGH